ncbi:MAG: MATE family efflux transporter [Gammaproteobacteria bacterium]|nr:MATE family efflux transporter [Gammaproteobacteria bacterium]
MRKLTDGSIPRHIIAMSIPTAVGLLVQTLYHLVDLYFVAGLGDAALAGVSSAGIAMFIIMAMTQVLGVGTVAMISHAAGRGDQVEANLVFNQSMVLSILGAGLTLALGYGLGARYMGMIGADAATVTAGTTYLYYFIPCLAIQFAFTAMGSALRGTGIVKPTMVVQLLTVLINILLAPVLIAGWGTGVPLGVAGAGLASSLAAGMGFIIMWFYFHKLEEYVKFNRHQWRPIMTIWRRLVGIGLPAGGEFALMFIYMMVIYTVIRDFGAAAQAGFGLGSRVMQAIFLPAMAIAFSAPAIAGQNFGAGKSARVRATFTSAMLMSSCIMFLLTLLCQFKPEWFVGAFTDEADVLQVGTDFLRIISWNLVATGIIFTCSGMFQALGNTWPALWSGATRLLTFAVPVIWLSTQPEFKLVYVWYMSVITVPLQALVSYLFVRHEFRRRLDPVVVETTAQQAEC